MRGFTSVAELLSDVVLFPQVLVNIPLRDGQNWRDNKELQAGIRNIELELGTFGRVLVRASGTEPLLRVMVEARSLKQAEDCASRLVAIACSS